MVRLPGPADVVAGVIAFLRQRGYNAATTNQLDPTPGVIKVTRTGGSMLDKIDKAQVLIEVWHEDQAACFTFARRVWAEFAAVSQDDQNAFPGLTVYRATPSIPLQYPDPRKPDMDRHQFIVSMSVAWEEIRINEN